MVQDRTGEGLPARYKLRVLVALRASGALRFGGVREMTVQPRKGGTESGLQGSGTLPVSSCERRLVRENEIGRWEIAFLRMRLRLGFGSAVAAVLFLVVVVLFLALLLTAGFFLALLLLGLFALALGVFLLLALLLLFAA